MKRKYDEPLSNHTTFKIGGPADVLSIPESEEELINEIRRCQSKGIDYRILGKGSNILVDDRGVNGIIIKNTKSCTTLERDGNIVRVGGSVLLPRFVRFCVNNDLEGMENLFSIPATVGGAIYMNAGNYVPKKGRNIEISDNLISVKIFDGDKKRKILKESCDFKTRDSIFHRRKNWIILEAKFKLENQPKTIGEKKIKDRMDRIKDWPIYEHPNAGSIFKQKSFFSRMICKKLLNKLKIGDAKIENNWIYNLGNASFDDVLFLINMTKFLSYLSFKKPELEIEIWNN